MSFFGALACDARWPGATVPMRGPDASLAVDELYRMAIEDAPA